MGEFRSLAVPAVRHSDLLNLLSGQGFRWDECQHVAATVSLARVMQGGTGRVTLPVAALLDLVTLPGAPAEAALSADDFPGQSVLDDDAQAYATAVRDWQHRAKGRRFRLSFDMGRSLRRFVKTGEIDADHGRLLINGRRELVRSVTALVSAGMEPRDLEPVGSLPQAAVEAWQRMEDDVPAMTTVRQTVWLHPAELEAQADEVSRAAAHRMRRAIEVAFGPRPASGRWTLIHHGFYFYTPTQWALFQSLRQLPDVDQFFVVHDDGTNPAFKTWRLFFSENRWNMPAVEVLPSSVSRTSAATAYEGAMLGRPVDGGALESDVRLLRYRNPAEFVRDWRQGKLAHEGRLPPRFFGADAESVVRFVRRLDRDESGGTIDLSELPVGIFLLGVHGCIDARPGLAPRVRITRDRLLDIVSSGFLEIPSEQYMSAVGAVRRSIDFFRGCDDGHQWVERARALQRLVWDEVSALGAREPGDSDVVRIRRTLTNPLRTVPWADLTTAESDLVLACIAAVVRIVEETAAEEELSLADHLSALRERLERGLRGLPERQATEILSKFRGFADVGDAMVDVADLIDVVRMVLGQEPDLDASGDQHEPDSSLIAPLRGLDALGFEASSRPVHLCNLADDVFPAGVPSFGWPFTSADLESTGDLHEIALEILGTRSQQAGQSDQYLLWLALDGVDGSSIRAADTTVPPLTLSWIEELRGELRNASSMLTLLARPDDLPETLVEFIGGIPIDSFAGVSSGDPTRQAIAPAPTAPSAETLGEAVALIDPRAAAIARACPRRFALQWALGETAAFRADHHHTMLYGNVLGALIRTGRMSRERAERACDDLWRQFTAGERSSSRIKAVVKARGAREEWIWTLQGSSRDGRNSPFDIAYRSAIATTAPRVDDVVPRSARFLPLGAEHAAICTACPVKDRCLAAVFDD